MEERKYSSISKPVRKKDAMSLVCGKPVYVEDIVPQGYLVVKVLHSPHAHALIEEINTDPIEHYAVKMNGKVLTEGTDYTTNVTSADGTWSVRTYAVKKELFAEEGEYHLVVESVDKTDTAAYSDIKNLKLAFVVDQTAPVVVFSGLESGGRYEAQEQTVTAVPTDDGGKLKTFQAVVTDKKGEQKETLITLKGDELETYLAEHDGRISFEIPEGLEQQVTVSCSDHAVKEDGSTNTYDQTFDNVTVSTSKMIIFFANKPPENSTDADDAGYGSDRTELA